MAWIKIAGSLGEIPFNGNGLAEVAAEGKLLCIGRHHESVFAFAPKCPHAGGALVQGWVDALGNVVCPLHRYKFCLKNGRNVSGEGYQLRHWPVTVREDGVWVDIQTEGLFSLFGGS